MADDLWLLQRILNQQKPAPQEPPPQTPPRVHHASASPSTLPTWPSTPEEKEEARRIRRAMAWGALGGVLIGAAVGIYKVAPRFWAENAYQRDFKAAAMENAGIGEGFGINTKLYAVRNPGGTCLHALDGKQTPAVIPATKDRVCLPQGTRLHASDGMAPAIKPSETKNWVVTILTEGEIRAPQADERQAVTGYRQGWKQGYALRAADVEIVPSKPMPVPPVEEEAPVVRNDGTALRARILRKQAELREQGLLPK